jgi:sarcosine oxidase gamma subunit
MAMLEPAQPGIRRLAAVRVLALRHLPGAALAEPLPPPGCCIGGGPRLLWCSPSECLWIGDDSDLADEFLARHAPGRDPLAYAVDRTDGSIVLELDAAVAQHALPRCMDAMAIPAAPGNGSRGRLADIQVTLLCVSADRLWLIADRTHEAYLLAWLDPAGLA